MTTDHPADERDNRVTRTTAAFCGVVSAAVALATGEFAAGLVRSWASPVEAVAETVIDEAPSSVTRFGIETFGSNDKPALVIGILVVLAVLAVPVGVFGRRRPVVATVAFAVLGLVGFAASIRDAALTDGVPALLAAAAGIATFRVLARLAAAPATRTAVDAEPTRRQFVLGATTFVAVGAIAASAGRVLRDRFSAAASRAGLALPSAPEPLPAPADAASFDVDGLTSLYTSNDTFYRIDTALSVPQVPVESWSLRVHGMVDEPYEVTFDELAEMGLIEVDITLTCVSNPVGGDLVGNARWLGVPLRTVLDRAGVDPQADQIVGRSSDGYTCGFPVDAAYDRDAIVAIGMNGEPLPLEHGFPARLVTPGLYGYVSATKWLTEIELATFANFDQYWVPRGYAEQAPIKTSARIDVPRSGVIIPPGEAVIAGVAWAQTRGIERVEVKVDDAPFADATLAEALNDDTWRQWQFPWNPTEGNHRIVVRATDGTGETQTEERSPILPDGASGWQSRLVTVRAA